MGMAWLLTVLALAGAWAGVFLVRDGEFSEHLAAAGGGLLSGIALFRLIPEIGERTGRPYALLGAAGVACALVLLDRVLTHGGHPAHRGVVWPLVLATAIHSILDGWSVRMLGTQPLSDLTVTAGLALHKMPEGAALGWITRRSLGSARQAFFISGAAELFTLAGAIAEPSLNASGSARFGTGWTTGVLSLIAGGFFFLAFHAIAPAWRRRGVWAIFAATLMLLGTFALIRE
jgi:zinc transporter ZupT